MFRLTGSTRGYGSKVNCLSLSHPFFGMRLTCHACFGDVWEHVTLERGAGMGAWHEYPIVEYLWIYENPLVENFPRRVSGRLGTLHLGVSFLLGTCSPKSTGWSSFSPLKWPLEWSILVSCKVSSKETEMPSGVMRHGFALLEDSPINDFPS